MRPLNRLLRWARCWLPALGIAWTLVAPAPVAAQDPPPDRRFGAIESFRDPVAAAEAGVGWDRILFYWSELQPGGSDDWNSYHVPGDWLDLAASAGREVVALLKGTPSWATDGQAGCGVPRGLNLPVDDPGYLWATFARRTVSAYQGRVSRWIIWNEPDITADTYGSEWCGNTQEYYQLLKVAYLAAHQVDPTASIHLAGLTHWHDPKYLRNFLAVATSDPTGAANGYYFDVVSLHIYFRSETVPDIINATRSALSAYGISKPIWVNETNAPPNSDPEWQMPQANYEINLEEQASFLLQSFALALGSGAERVAVYKLLDNDLQPGFEPFGIIRPDRSRRPAYYAYRLITNEYAGTRAATIDRQAKHIVVTLDRGHLATRVLWARSEAGIEATVPAQAGSARLIDQTGAERMVEPVDGQYVIALPGARCADSKGCIIGGPTVLLVEETGAAPTPAETPTPEQEPEATSSLDPTISPTPEPTATIRPTRTPSPTPSPSPSPTVTEPLSPTAAATPSPQVPNPGDDADAAQTRRGRQWVLPLAAGSSGVLLIGLAALLLIRQRR